MDNSKSFLFNIAWRDVLMDYPAEVRYEVYDAIIEYAASGRLSELKPLAKMAFSFIKKEMDDYQRKQVEKLGRNRENGRKGGAPKGNVNAMKTTENNPKQPKTTENNPKRPKQPKCPIRARAFLTHTKIIYYYIIYQRKALTCQKKAKTKESWRTRADSPNHTTGSQTCCHVTARISADTTRIW